MCKVEGVTIIDFKAYLVSLITMVTKIIVTNTVLSIGRKTGTLTNKTKQRITSL